MNAPFSAPAAQSRHKFTIDDALEMTARGLIGKRTELLDGEIYDMADDGDRHISVTMELMRGIVSVLPRESYFVGVQTTLRLSKHNAPSPDIYVLAGGPPDGVVSAERILLVIEVADTSIKDDLADSASRYARHGVREFWVVDVNARVTHVHRGAVDGAYPPPRRVDADTPLRPALIPDLAIILDDIAPAD